MSCRSGNQHSFTAEINIHFPGRDNVTKPYVLAFPTMVICLDCGFTECQIADAELSLLAEGMAETRDNVKRKGANGF